MVEDASEGTALALSDTEKRFVRLQRVRDDGFVEFSFEIGDPGLALELIMPMDAFRAFCRANSAMVLPSVETWTLHGIF